MNKVKTSKQKLVTSLVVVMIMLMSMAVPALAGPPPQVSGGTGPDDQAQSALTKRFLMPVGLTIPAATFTFTFEPLTIDGEDYEPGPPSNMPSIPNATIVYTGTEVTNATSKVLVEENEETGVKTVTKESADLIIGRNIQWQSAGVYVYEIAETASGIPLTGATKEETYYSTGRYLIEFWVEEQKNPDNTSTFWVKYISATIHPTLIDVYYPGDQGGHKVDPTPGKWVVEDGVIVESGFSELIFTNKYWKSDGSGPTDPPDPDNAALILSKTVDGNHPDNEDRTTVNFNFTGKVTQPEVFEDARDFSAYVLAPDGTTVKQNLTVKSGEGFTVILRHGERLVFTDLIVGSKVEFEEAAHGDYKPKYVRNFAGIEEYPGTAGEPWGFPRASSDDEGPHRIPQGKGSKADFTNTRTGATPTGLDVDDLPYIMLLGLALAGFIGFAVIKTRRRVN